MRIQSISAKSFRGGRAVLLFSILALVSALAPCARAGAQRIPAGETGAPNPQARKVDSVLIKKLYMNGDFDQAIDILEKDYKTIKTLSHNDSVFIFKHLGVMYAADYGTRERGKMYMYLLLTIEPTAKILDMYASDMIYMIFNTIQSEFATNRTPPDTTKGEPKPQPVPPPPPKPEPSSRHLGFWIGGAAVVAAGVGAYFLILSLSHSDSQSHSF